MSESKPAATIEIIYNPGTECYEAIQTTGTTKNVLIKFDIQMVTNILTNHLVLYLETMAQREQNFTVLKEKDENEN